MSFLESKNLLSASQFGFRCGKSTADAVHELTNTIVSNLDSKSKCLSIFLDLAKAFDTVSVPHILKKLDRIGVRGLPLLLFKDYLNNRTQRVRIDNWTSDEVNVSYGVPQGSILGPSLFLIYINDLCQLQLHNGRILTFADDTALLFYGNSWDDVFRNAQAGFQIVCTWLKNNVLTLNAAKTKYITFAIRKNLLPPTALSISAHTCHHPVLTVCDCPTLQRTESIKYLGVVIDQSLSFKSHLGVLVTRLRKVIYIFKTLRHTADRQTIKMVYDALCQSLINYCVTSWGGAAKTHILEVERAQRAILKVGAGLPFRFPTAQVYKKWDVLTVRQTFLLNIILKKHSQLKYNKDLSKGKRRKGTVCYNPLFKTSFSHKFYCFLGSFIYNKANTALSIYQKPRSGCRASVSKWLKSMDYEATEKLLIPLT